MSKNTPRPSDTEIDRLLIKYIRDNQEKTLHIDELVDVVKLNWRKWFDSNPNDNRHYVRTRLQSLKDSEDELGRGRIGNPKYSHYCYPKPKDDLTYLDWEELWEEFFENGKKAKSADKEFVGYNGKYVVSISKLKTKNGEPTLEISGNKIGKNKDFSESNFREAIIRLNTVAGRMHRPRKSLSKNIILVELVDRLEFDEDGYVVVKQKEFDPKKEFEELNPDDKGKFVEVLEDIKKKKPKSKGSRTVANLVNEAKQRSKGKSEVRESRKRNFDLDEDWINEKSKLTHCEVTGIEFTPKFESGPFARSLDCRDPELDYTKDNVDVVVSIYNLAKNKWPPQIVEEFCIRWHQNLSNR